MERVVMFGAAGGGKRLLAEVQSKYKVIAFVDNDELKWGDELEGIPIMNPEKLLSLEYTYVIITSAPGLEDIKMQCLQLGIELGRIITTYVTPELESRIIFLEKLARLLQEEKGQVAEAGVFEGDFAKNINKFFPQKDCYLFDTFQGFDERDIQYETELSNANVGEYGNTSIDIVMSKMPYPDKVKIYPGYFPQSAKNIDEKFCFVNLDLDLYEPTYQGLKFFEDKMVRNGCILVHDYFAENFKGPRLAVERFLTENQRNLYRFPIGDGISIMICGF